MIKKYKKISFVLGISGIAPLTLQLTLFRLLPHFHSRSPIFLIFALPIIGVGLVLLGVANLLKAKQQSTLWALLLLFLLLVPFSPHYVNPPAYLETLRKFSSIASLLVLVIIVALPDRAKQSKAQNSELGKLN